ncbi:MAG: BsuPI-related putative proteinase inhibitor [Actinomycetota bacterium]
MSDPLIHLQGERSRTPAPVDAIRSRAARIERRKHIVLGSGGGIIALIALSALFAGGLPGGDAKRDLAQALRLPPTPPIVAGTASPATTEGETSGENRLATAPDMGAATDGGSSAATLSAPGSRSSAEGAAPAAAADQPGEPSLDVTLEVSDQSFLGRRFELTLSACNNGSETIDQTFPTGQRYDFEVGRNGEVVWRWSDGQVFTQEYGTEPWEPGECKTYSEIWNGSDSDGSFVEAGTYQAEGVLASDPQLRSGQQDFCVESC